MPAFTLLHVNFGNIYFFNDYDAAVAYARKACFQAAIYSGFAQDGKLVATWCPIGGLKEEKNYV